MDTQTGQYDVFLSYHWRDRSAVEQLAGALSNRGLQVFFDRWYLTPGLPWPQALEKVLARCHAAAICVGPQGMGPWQLREQYLALDRQSREKTFPVIPVVLPGADPPLGFLSLNTWIALQTDTENHLVIESIARAIRGLPPGKEQVAKAVARICPYRGLQVFREEDAPFFFGREAFAKKLAEEVHRKPFIALVGASGSGKSSLVRAGLVPQLRAGVGGQVWDIATLSPGPRPMQALAAALIPILEPDLGEVDRLAEIGKLARHFASKTVSLHDVVRRCLEKQRGTDRLLLFIDQWEELYSLCKEDDTRSGFINELLAASDHAAVKVVMTLRGDFYGRALNQRILADRLQDSVVNLGPMKRDELRRTLEEPAAVVHLEFEPGLVDRILDEVGDQPGNLPLLEFVLADLWDKRRGYTLHFEAYEAIKGVKGAIANRADNIFQTELTFEQQEAARRVLMQMVRPGEGAPDTRKRTLLPTEDDPALAVVRKLADARLLVTSRDETQDNALTVEIAHEALIQNWGLLQLWVNEDREFLQTRERLEAAAGLWKQEGELEDRLLAPGRPLMEAEDLMERRRADLSDSVIQFIESSLAAEQRRQEALRAAHLRKLRRTRYFAAASLLVAIAMAGLLAYAINRKMAADFATRQSEARLQEIEKRRRDADDARKKAEQERKVALSRGLAAQASLLAERGKGEDTMFKASALAVASSMQMPNAEAYGAAMKLLQWFPVKRIEGDSKTPQARPQFAFSPDGRFLVVRSDQSIRLIETASNKVLWRTAAQGEYFTGIRFSTDSRMLLINGREHAWLINTESAEEVFSAGAGEAMIHIYTYSDSDESGSSDARTSMSPDGRWLTLISEEGRSNKDIITVIDARTGQKACSIEHSRSRSQGELIVFFSRNGGLLGIKDRPSFHLFQLPSCRKQKAITVNNALREYFIGDDRWLVIEEYKSNDHECAVHVIDPETGGELIHIPLGKNGDVSFAPDGRNMLTKSPDANLVRLLEVPTGVERASWRESLSRAFFDADGRWLLIKNETGPIRLVDPRSGLEKRRIEVGCDAGQFKLISAADLLVAACENGQIDTFTASTGEKKSHFQVGPFPFISHNARFIVTQDQDKSLLRFHETSTGKEFGAIVISGDVNFSHDASIPGTSLFSEDSRFLAIPGSQGSVQLADFSQAYSPASLEAIKQGPVVLSRDRKLLAFAGPDYTTRVVELATGKEVGVVRHQETAHPVSISPDNRLLTTEQKSVMQINEVETGGEITRSAQSWQSSISVSPAGNCLMVRNWGSGFDRLIEAGTLKEIMQYPSDSLCCLPVFSPDGHLFAMANRHEHSVLVFDTKTGSEQLKILPDAEFGSNIGPCCPGFSPDGRILAMDVLGVVRLFDLSTKTWRKERFKWPSSILALDISFSPDGRTLVAGGSLDTGEGVSVALFDIAAEKELTRIHSGSLGASSSSIEPLHEFSIDFSIDSRLFAVGAAAGEPVRLFATATGQELARMEMGLGFAGVVFSPDGHTLAAASSNGSVRLLDVADKRLLGTSQHAKAVTHLEFSPDSRLLITSGEEGIVLMNETQTGREIARFEHGEPVEEAHFSADGNSLVIIGSTQIRIWPADPEWPFMQLCARTGRNLNGEEWRTLIGESEPWQAICPNWQ